MPNSLRILIAEDNEDIHLLLEECLQHIGLIEFTTDGEQARDKLCSGRYALAVLDYHLPGMTGLDAAYDARKRQIWTPIIMITAKREFEIVESAVDLKIDAFLIKPFSAKKLCAAVEKVLHARTSVLVKQAYEKAKAVHSMKRRTVKAASKEPEEVPETEECEEA